MDLESSDNGSAARFAAYVEGLVSVIGHKDRAGPLRDYCTGLLMPCKRKSVEPLAAVTAPARVAAQHQSLLHFVGEGRWSDDRVLAKVSEMVLPHMERHGPIEAWIIDDTGFPKKGRHSVGVARQYCGQLGKEDNCQVAVSLSVANAYASLPVAYRLYLPQEWSDDRARLRKVGVPDDVGFQSKHEIALDQLRFACAAGLPRGVVLMDAGYGNDSTLRAATTALGLTYIAGILSNTTVWAPGSGPLPAKPWSGRGRPPTLLRRDADHRPGLGQGPRPRLARACLAHDHLAGRHQRALVFALCTGAGQGRAARLQTQRELAARVAADRVAQGREGANPILAFDPACRHPLRSPGGACQAALAH
jgi:SRSO17 transposase